MQYGVVAYCVPHSVWPHGHHNNPKLPLMYMGLSSQKNDMVVYMLFLLHSQPERAWFDAAWKATGKKSHLEVGGMGCCLRFRKLEDLSLEVIAEAMRRMPVTKYLENHAAMLSRLKRKPGKEPAKKGRGDGKTGAEAKSTPTPSLKMKPAGKSTAKKPAAAKPG
jgi:hypothetical protein